MENISASRLTDGPIGPENNPKIKTGKKFFRKLGKLGRIFKKIGKRNALIVAVVLAVGVVAFYGKGLVVAALVNGHPISRLAVIKELEKNSGGKALDVLITKSLISEEISKKKIMVSNDEVQAEMKKIEARVAAQGQTLDNMLTARGETRASFSKQILIQKQIEKILAEKTAVTDSEVDKYIKDSKIKITKGQGEVLKNQIRDQLQQQKLQQEVGQWLDGLRSQAKINFFVNY